MSYDDAVRAIRKAQRIAVAAHQRPDGDAVACCLALRLALTGLDKTVTVFLPEPAGAAYDFLPGYRSIAVIADQAAALRRRPVDLLVACDTSDLERLGAVKDLRRNSSLVLDHHPDNRRFGAINIIEPAAACTCQVVAALIQRLGLRLTRDLATCLYTGLIYDTGRFMYDNTDATALRFAARLAGTGIDLAAINRRLAYSLTPADLELKQLAIQRLAVDEREPRLAGVTFTARDLKCHGEPDDWSGVGEIPRSLAGVEVTYLLRENADGSVRCSLRSNPPFAVGPVARALGGGGHELAAGCTLCGPLDTARKRVTTALRTVLRRTG